MSNTQEITGKILLPTGAHCKEAKAESLTLNGNFNIELNPNPTSLGLLLYHCSLVERNQHGKTQINFRNILNFSELNK